MSRTVLWLVAAVLIAGPAHAGPPYLSDDPEPTDLGHWEIYDFVQGGGVSHIASGEAGLDFNYGAMKDLQLTAVVPMAYQFTDGRPDAGMGVVELAAKQKILHQTDGGLMPDLSVFPRFFVPTAPRRLASDRLNVLLPVWGEKDFGPWSLFGGGGYQINPGPGARNFWTGGLALTRALSDRLSIGGEVYRNTSETVDALPLTEVNLGLTYKLNNHFSLLFAGGPGVENARKEGLYDFYFSLKEDY